MPRGGTGTPLHYWPWNSVPTLPIFSLHLLLRTADYYEQLTPLHIAIDTLQEAVRCCSVRDRYKGKKKRGVGMCWSSSKWRSRVWSSSGGTGVIDQLCSTWWEATG